MYRNKNLLEAVRDFPCQICGAEDGTMMYNCNQQRGGNYDRKSVWEINCFA